MSSQCHDITSSPPLINLMEKLCHGNQAGGRRMRDERRRPRGSWTRSGLCRSGGQSLLRLLRSHSVGCPVVLAPCDDIPGQRACAPFVHSPGRRPGSESQTSELLSPSATWGPDCSSVRRQHHQWRRSGPQLCCAFSSGALGYDDPAWPHQGATGQGETAVDDPSGVQLETCRWWQGG